MDRLFLDANILFSAAYRADAGLLAFWRLKHAMLCSSRYAVEEARINLLEPVQKERLNRLIAGIHLLDAAELGIPKGISLPEKDIPIILAAMEAHATHLITGDLRHFGRYFNRRVSGILIMSPADYLKTSAAR